MDSPRSSEGVSGPQVPPDPHRSVQSGDGGRSLAVLKATYTLLAPFYAPIVPYFSGRARRLGGRWLGVQDGDRVLDVGTGTARALAALAAATPSGWAEGIDATPAMVARARRRMARGASRHYRIRRGDAEALPYPADAFDAVFCSYLLDVVPVAKRLPVLRELRRVLRPDGRLVLVYWAPPRRPLERLWGALARRCPLLFGGGRPVTLRPWLRRARLVVRRRTSLAQWGLRSGVIRATPG